MTIKVLEGAFIPFVSTPFEQIWGIWGTTSILVAANSGGSAVYYPTHVPRILTNGVKAVDVEAGWVSGFSYVNLLQAVVWVVGQYDLYSHHTGLVQARLPREMVLGRQTFPCHMVKQLVGFHGAESWSGDLAGQTERRGVNLRDQRLSEEALTEVQTEVLSRQTRLGRGRKKETKLLDNERNKTQCGPDWSISTAWNKSLQREEWEKLTAYEHKALHSNNTSRDTFYIKVQMHPHRRDRLIQDSPVFPSRIFIQFAVSNQGAECGTSDNALQPQPSLTL